MAWFKKTLEDMDAAVDAGDWAGVRKIYEEHRGNLKVESYLVEQDISGIARRLNDYGVALNQIGTLLRSKSINKEDVKLQVRHAINAAHFFEATIQHHIKLGRFIEEKME